MKFRNNGLSIKRVKGENRFMAVKDNKLTDFERVFFNLFIKSGKKAVVSWHFDRAYLLVTRRFHRPPRQLIGEIFTRLKPVVMLRAQHQGREKRLLPHPVTPHRQVFLAANWLKKAIESRPERELYSRIFHEIEDIVQKKGRTLKLKHNFYREVLANKSFLRLLRFRKK